MSFSERNGIVRKQLQINSMNRALKNQLWNVYYIQIYKHYSTPNSKYVTSKNVMEEFYRKAWVHFFNNKIDSYPKDGYTSHLKRYFSEERVEWYRIYDFIEYVANYSGFSARTIKKFTDHVNFELERNMSPYRFVQNQLTPITEELEILEIEAILSSSSNFFDLPKKHIQKALDLFSSFENPDYHNSIKESISAVESACKIITSDKDATLGQALKKLDQQISIHPALQKGFSNIYGYASDSNGIRHAMVDEDEKCSQEDARFMLVACSAFVNYLIEKWNKANNNS